MLRPIPSLLLLSSTGLLGGPALPSEPAGAPAAAERSAAAPTDGLLYPGYAAFPPARPPALPAALVKPLTLGGSFLPGWFVVRFRGEVTPADEAWLAELTAAARARAGLEPLPWVVPHAARGAWIDRAETLRALARAARVERVGRHQPGYKLDPDLVLAEVVADGAALELELVPGHPPADVLRALEACAARALGPPSRDGRILRIQAPPGALTRIAWVEGIRVLRRCADPDPEAPADLRRGSAGAGGGSRAGISATLVLRVAQGWDSDDGTLGTTSLARLQASDGSRQIVNNGEELVLGFERSVPAGATVGAIRVFVEHHEEAGVDPGDIVWKLGHGSLTSPTIERTTAAPLRSGESREGLDTWAPGVLVPDPNDLKLVIANDDRRDETLLDHVYVELDLVPAAEPPRITSTPALTASAGQAYLYDADGRAEASGSEPLQWSLVEAPAGFAIAGATGAVSWTPTSVGTFAVTLRATNAHGEDTQSFAVLVAEPPFPPTLLPASKPAVVYLPPERLAFGAAKSQQRLNVFLPRGTPPPAGWPVLLNNRAGGGVTAPPLARLSATGGTAPLHALVAAGVAVVDFGVTGVGNDKGLFYPPGHASGRYESFHPADDNAEKEAEWAVQWLKTQAQFPLDPGRIVLRGSSQGAIVSMWAAMGPERARASGSAQVRASTRVQGVVALQPPTWVWGFEQDDTFDTRMVAHFEQEALPGVAATSFQQVARELQETASVMRFAFESEDARLSNATQAVCLLYYEPVKHVGGLPADLSLDERGFPRLHDALTLPYVHDSWAGYVLFARLLGLSPAAREFHLQNSIFAVRDTSALPPPYDWHTRKYRGPITGAAANALAHEWILRTLGLPPGG